MSRSQRRIWILAVGCASLLGGLKANAVNPTGDGATGDSNPYAVIIDRNVFRLNPPPPPPPPPEVKPADLPQYQLTGISKVGEAIRVFFALNAKNAKDGPTYINLSAGERQGDLQLVSVDKSKGVVDIINTGTPMKLTLASNSFAAKTGAPAPGPAMPGTPGGARRLPGFPAAMPAPGQADANAPGGGAVVIGGNGNSSGDNNAGGVNPAANYAQNSGNNNYGGSRVTVAGNSPMAYGGPGGGGGGGPTVPITPISPGQPSAGQAQNWPPVQAASPAEQIIAWKAQQQGIDVNGGGNGNVSVGGSGGGRKPIVAPPMPPLPGMQQ